MKKMIVAVMLFIFALSASACDVAESQTNPIENSSAAEESTIHRKERKENEKKAREEEAQQRGEQREESEAYESPWKNYTEPQLDTGMGRVFPTLESPAGATAMFIHNYKEWDMLGVSKCISDYEEYDTYQWSAEPEDLYDGLMALVLTQSQYSIISEEVDGNTAVVTIQCKAFSGEVVMDLYAESLIQAGLYEFYEAYDDKILKNMNFNFVPYVKIEAEAYLVKCPDGLWRLDAYAYENEAVVNALTGNLTEIVDAYYFEYYFDKYNGGWYDDEDYGRGQDKTDFNEWYKNWYRENFEQGLDDRAV